MQGKRHPPPKHRDTPADASLQQAHAYCKNPSAAWTTHRRAPSPQEADILDAILDGRLPLDTPPKFPKQILTATEIALFHDQMRQNFGYLQIPIKVSTRIHPDMTSVSVARLFSPANLGDNKEAVQLCDSLRQDMHSCYLHPHGRKLIVQFNSKAKAARWRDKPIPFRGQLTWMRHYRRPEDPYTDLDSEEVQQHMAYSFRLLQVPAYVKSMQVLQMLRHLGVGIVSMDVAKYQGTGEDDANSYLVVTDGDTVPVDLQGKSRIVIGLVTLHVFHFQDHNNTPCRKCAALDHQLERCTTATLQHDRIITLSSTLWSKAPNTEIPQQATFAHWWTSIEQHLPPTPASTQASLSVATHEAGTQAVELVDYGTTPETRLSDGSSQTDDLGLGTPDHPTLGSETSSDHSISVGTWMSAEPSHSTRAETQDVRGPWPQDDSAASQGRPGAPSSIDEVDMDISWDNHDGAISPPAAQPTPLAQDMNTMGTTQSHSSDWAMDTEEPDTEPPAWPSDQPSPTMEVYATPPASQMIVDHSPSMLALGLPHDRPPTNPAPQVREVLHALSIATATLHEPIDLSDFPTEDGQPVQYAQTGVEKLDWCGYPEIAAASAVWGQPVYVFQEQETANTWWLWRITKLPTKYLKRLQTWIQEHKNDLQDKPMPLAITMAAQLEFLLTDFPFLARSMLWAVGTPDMFLSRCSPHTLLTWGSHILLEMAHATLDAIGRLHDQPGLHGIIAIWKADILHAVSLDQAVQLATDAKRWGELLDHAETPSSVMDFHILTVVSASQLPWAALFVALLDLEGIEQDETPDVTTLGGFLQLAETGDLLTILDQLHLGRWAKLLPWVSTYAYAWGYTSGGYRE
ncbi:hypothetical protein DYB32_008818 [Aphanomyces invadans]|uniref:Uncharacterized protein n=1 Tax=Aphanomyces invadans TaxID=157072 RepID=A0A418AK25_9STRA|nr:hypothetical protein DYB32_008818 [Aphanomyces invadans]